MHPLWRPTGVRWPPGNVTLPSRRLPAKVATPSNAQFGHVDDLSTRHRWFARDCRSGSYALSLRPKLHERRLCRSRYIFCYLWLSHWWQHHRRNHERSLLLHSILSAQNQAYFSSRFYTKSGNHSICMLATIARGFSIVRQELGGGDDLPAKCPFLSRYRLFFDRCNHDAPIAYMVARSRGAVLHLLSDYRAPDCASGSQADGKPALSHLHFVARLRATANDHRSPSRLLLAAGARLGTRAWRTRRVADFQSTVPRGVRAPTDYMASSRRADDSGICIFGQHSIPRCYRFTPVSGNRLVVVVREIFRDKCPG